MAAALVVGDDPVAATHVALGIARIEGLYRRVAIGDLIGDLAPLRPAADEDPHGLADCFLYGVSLNRIARPLQGARNVFVLPAGTEPVMPEDVIRHPRWRRLIAGFREMDALLLLVASPSTPGLADLARVTEGAIAVGTPDLQGIPALARVRVPFRSSRAIPEDRLPSDEALAGAAARHDAPKDSLEHSAENSHPAHHVFAQRARWPLVAAAAAVLVVAGGLGGSALLRARANRSGPPEAQPLAAIADSSRGALGAPADAPRIVVANPQDSAAASMFAVEVLKANTEAAALAHIRIESPGLPALTVAPIMLSDGSRWYRVLAGAFSDTAAAESLLRSLRGTPVLASDRGGVVRAPFALLALDGADSSAARAEIARLRDRGVSAYGLIQPAGHVHVYVGAFATPEDAASAEAALREAGVVPAVVYRIGRAF